MSSTCTSCDLALTSILTQVQKVGVFVWHGGSARPVVGAAVLDPNVSVLPWLRCDGLPDCPTKRSILAGHFHQPVRIDEAGALNTALQVKHTHN